MLQTLDHKTIKKSMLHPVPVRYPSLQ